MFSLFYLVDLCAGEGKSGEKYQCGKENEEEKIPKEK